MTGVGFGVGGYILGGIVGARGRLAASENTEANPGVLEGTLKCDGDAFSVLQAGCLKSPGA